MASLTIDDFSAYFEALHGREPYPWQRRLAAQAIEGRWPGAIDLPTGSGKTAAIDIAIFALACQAAREPESRKAPRRIFFCVNRRIIVDEAHQRAATIARKLWKAERDEADAYVLHRVASALRAIGGTRPDARGHDLAPPLDVLELRGGIYRDNRWARSATQPTVICTTIDQLGSRLLFRGYGISSSAAPIAAAMIAYDSLILLDEAHISQPFRQTLDQVAQYLDPSSWAEQPLGIAPLRVVPMTATPTAQMVSRGVVALDDEDRASAHLRCRLTASKPAELMEVADVAEAAAKAAAAMAQPGPRAIGIIVNRIATARQIAAKLSEQFRKKQDVTVELVIGSMRPIDRDAQSARLAPFVGPDRAFPPTQTTFVVATQCLEVGADYDFDCLVAECASLDALRQRFGRLNRAGRTSALGDGNADSSSRHACAVILAARRDIRPEDKLDDAKPLDPIYGNALARTWNWLTVRARDSIIDFGINAFASLLAPHGQPSADLLAPTANLCAPVVMPAYLDFLCQTSPRPTPDPDVSLFLHGPQRGEPDVQVCWRADLVDDNGQTTTADADSRGMTAATWPAIVALLPPTSRECMSVPISRLRRWLTGVLDDTTRKAAAAAADGDLQGVAAESPESAAIRGVDAPPAIRGVLWRGPEQSELLESVRQIRPGDTLVLPLAAAGWNELGHIPALASDSAARPIRLDQAEPATQSSRGRTVLRIHPAMQSRWPVSEARDQLFLRLQSADERPTLGELRTLLRHARGALAEASGASQAEPSQLPAEADTPGDPVRTELLQALDALLDAPHLLRAHYPDGRGEVLTATRLRMAPYQAILPSLDDGDDQLSRLARGEHVLLEQHTAHVLEAAAATLNLLPLTRTLPEVAGAIREAALLHDWGKADERFQAMLRGTDRTDAWLLSGLSSEFWAKSPPVPDRHAARVRAGLPPGFRHEMLSMQLAERSARLPLDAPARELILHLIAAHHGYARPLAPVVIDTDPPDVQVEDVALAAAQRAGSGAEDDVLPAHRLDAGVPERFWLLTRRYGWWGLAYLEAILRLADQQASAAEDAGVVQDPSPSQLAGAQA